MLGILTAATERMPDAVTYSADGTLGCSHVLPQLAADSESYKEQSQIKAILFPNAIPEIFEKEDLTACWDRSALEKSLCRA